MSDTTEIITAINAIAPGVSDEQIFIAADRLSWVNKFYKEQKALFEKAMIEVLNESPGRSRTIGTVRYYIGTDTKYKVRNNLEAIKAILTATSGDEERLSDCLASGWLKHGTTRKTFEEFNRPELFAEVFETITEDSLEEGKPQKLKSLDTRFLK